MGSSMEYLGSPDPRGERRGDASRLSLLNELRTEIGEETYQRIIHTLIDGDVKHLSPEDQAVVERIKKEYGRA